MIWVVVGCVVRIQFLFNYGLGVSIVVSVMVVQVGNCGEYVNVVVFLYVVKLGSGEYVYVVGSMIIDYCWVQWYVVRGCDFDYDFVMDLWGKGFVIFVVDGEFVGGECDVGIECEYDQSMGVKVYVDMSELQCDYYQQM